MKCIRLYFIVSLSVLFLANVINGNAAIDEEYEVDNNDNESDDTSSISVPNKSVESDDILKSNGNQNEQWTLKKGADLLKLEAELVNDEIIFVFSGFQVQQFNVSDYSDVIKVEVGESNIEFRFSKTSDKIYTKIVVNNHATRQITNNLDNDGRLIFRIFKNGKIILLESKDLIGYDSDIPSINELVIKKNVVEINFDSSGLKDAVITLSFQTPVKVAETDRTTMIIIIVVIIVVVVGLIGAFFTCAFHPKCWLNKKIGEYRAKRNERRINRKIKDNKQCLTETQTNGKNDITSNTNLVTNETSKPSKNEENHQVTVKEEIKQADQRQNQQEIKADHQQHNEAVQDNEVEAKSKEVKQVKDKTPVNHEEVLQQQNPPQEELFSAKDVTDDEGGWIEVKRKSRKSKKLSNDESKGSRIDPEARRNAENDKNSNGRHKDQKQLKSTSSNVENVVSADESTMKTEEPKNETVDEKNKMVQHENTVNDKPCTSKAIPERQPEKKRSEQGKGISCRQEYGNDQNSNNTLGTFTIENIVEPAARVEELENQARINQERRLSGNNPGPSAGGSTNTHSTIGTSTMEQVVLPAYAAQLAEEMALMEKVKKLGI